MVEEIVTTVSILPNAAAQLLQGKFTPVILPQAKIHQAVKLL